MKRVTCFVGLFLLFLFSAGLGYAQSDPMKLTAAEAVKLSVAEQRTVVLTITNNVVTVLSSSKTTAGQPKTPEQSLADRALINLVHALFTFDPKFPDSYHPNEAPGVAVVLVRIKKAAAATPDKTVVSVTADVVDNIYTSVYPDFLKAKAATQADDQQVLYFRVQIEMIENEHAYQQTMADLRQRDAELVKEMKQTYDDAIILSDGRHVLPEHSGQDFVVITTDTNDQSQVRVQGAYKREAQGIFDCMRAHRLSTGAQAREAGCR